jgi:hypothetical protein
VLGYDTWPREHVVDPISADNPRGLHQRWQRTGKCPVLLDHSCIASALTSIPSSCCCRQTVPDLAQPGDRIFHRHAFARQWANDHGVDPCLAQRDKVLRSPILTTR